MNMENVWVYAPGYTNLNVLFRTVVRTEEELQKAAEQNTAYIYFVKEPAA